tara:strand:- start:232 stop:813 length:582 start_codon:yes stop_codon:yes gene_type:complete
MASEIKANKISPATGTAFTLGDSGDTFTIPSGATLANSGTATGFGASNIVTAVSRATDQTVTKNALTKFQFNVEDADPEGWFDSSTNYRFQPDQSGNYLVIVNLFSSNVASSGDMIDGYIYKNGSEYFSAEFDKANYDFVNTNVFSCWVNLNGSSDFIEVYVRWGANGTLTFKGTGFNTAVSKNNSAIFVRMS